MIGLDTNVVIRYLVQDEPAQSAAASALIETFTEGQPGYVSLVTLIEVYWVLGRAYAVPRAECLDLIHGLVDSRELVIGHDDVARAALSAAAADGVDFADAVIAELGRAAGCEHTSTFDRRATRHPAMHLLATA